MEISYNFESLKCLGNFDLHYLDKFCFSTLLTEYPKSTVEFLYHNFKVSVLLSMTRMAMKGCLTILFLIYVATHILCKKTVSFRVLLLN